MNTVVVGGGVVGLCAAEALSRRDVTVTVVDAGVCGGEASAGNAGWVTSALAAPLSAPGVVRHSLGWMLRPNAPLHVRPSVGRGLGRWSLDFWRSSTPGRFRAGLVSLAALSDRAGEDFDGLAARGVRFEMHSDGLLLVALGAKAIDAEVAVLEEQRRHGYRGEFEVLSGKKARLIEPRLAEAVAAGILIRDDRHLRPESLVTGLVEHLRSRGVTLTERVRVEGVARRGRRWQVTLGDGAEPLNADSVVLAAGPNTRALLAPLGVELPLEGAKGYSITDSRPRAAPTKPLYMLEARLAATPFDGSLRIAGKLELGTWDPRPHGRRINGINRSVKSYLPEWRPGPTAAPWAGFRTLLPDGLPAIGPVPGRDGLFLTTGHGMLGLTLAPRAGNLLARAMLDERRPSLELAPFSPARFSRR